MEFLKVYEVNVKRYNEESYHDIVRVFIQEDTWDFHVFRLLEAENGYIVEMDNIDKMDIAEQLRMSIYQDVRGLFKKVDAQKACKAIVDFDLDRGCEVWESSECEDEDDAMDMILDGSNLEAISI